MNKRPRLTLRPTITIGEYVDAVHGTQRWCTSTAEHARCYRCANYIEGANPVRSGEPCLVRKHDPHSEVYCQYCVTVDLGSMPKLVVRHEAWDQFISPSDGEPWHLQTNIHGRCDRCTQPIIIGEACLVSADHPNRMVCMTCTEEQH